jgi:hypothetical protein
MNVLVLGCGPAGLMAAHAARLAGHNITIASRAEKSIIRGAQYLHAPIPEMTSEMEDGTITFRKVGTREGYGEKVYNNRAKRTSWSNYTDGQEVRAWDLRRVYLDLWENLSDRILDADLEAGHFSAMTLVWDRVFSTVPAKLLCTKPKEHRFLSQEVLIDTSVNGLEDNEITYNGDPDILWHRQSRVFGITGGREYNPFAPRSPLASKVTKPLSTNCNCFSKITRLGRYGAWDKEALTHDAFYKVMEELK